MLTPDPVRSFDEVLRGRCLACASGYYFGEWCARCRADLPTRCRQREDVTMPDRFRVLLTDRAWPDCDIEREILGQIGAELVEPQAQDEDSLIELAADMDAIGTCWAMVSDAVIRSAPKCRIVARFGIGLDNIAVETASELGILVTNVPDYCVEEVSDHTLGLLLAMSRKIAFFHNRTKRGEYDLSAAPTIRRLKGQVLGLVGFGKIARTLYPKARGLGLSVCAYSRSGNDYGTGCRMASFEEVLETSDYLSLHLPLTEETRGLLSAAEFKRMKQTAHLINTSRGGLVDQAALWAALQAGEISGAALDVFDPEPPDLNSPLFRDERVIVTPHAAFYSEESVRDLRTQASRQIAQVLQGSKPENVVNPQVLQDRR